MSTDVENKMRLLLELYQKDNKHIPDEWEYWFYEEKIKKAIDQETWFETKDGILGMVGDEIFFFSFLSDHSIVLLNEKIQPITSPVYLQPLGHSFMGLHPLINIAALRAFNRAQRARVHLDSKRLQHLNETVKWMML